MSLRTGRKSSTIMECMRYHIKQMSNEDIIKFIKDNCRDCNEIDREMYNNCEQCGFLKKFLENKGGNK